MHSYPCLKSSGNCPHCQGWPAPVRNGLSLHHRLAWLAAFSLVLLLVAGSTAANATVSKEIQSQFINPGREYSSGPLWVWNDMLTDEEIISTMEDLASQQVKQVFVHPRPGLMTPYLSADWFRMWKVALEEAEKLDMNVWIYDENSYPSGFAGGLVPEAMPQSRGRGLIIREQNQPPKWSDAIFAVFLQKKDKYVNVTKQVRNKKQLPAGKYLVANMQLAGSSGWFGGKYYVDLLYPGVTEKFLEITLGAYQHEIGSQFGERVPGVFSDEPHLAPAGGLHWTKDLDKLFQIRWGYSLVDNLPALVRHVGDWKRVRHNYYKLLLELFIDRWSKPYHDYCAKHNLEWTGHYWEHGWPGASQGGDNMAMYAWHQRPAIDTLMNQYSEATHAQFGNVRSVKELASVANQLGKKRTLCEAYGAGGWDLRFEDMKRIGDWLYVLGVNTLDQHLSYITIRGARKRDHPQSFSYHEPWWQAYHISAEYFARLSAALSHGQEINDILLIEPTSTAWMYQGDGKQLEELGRQFQELVVSLSKQQVEYDIGCEDIMARHGRVEGNRLVIGQRGYHTVVIPFLTECLNWPTMKLLDDFLSSGGTVYCCGKPPERVNGEMSDYGRLLSESDNWHKIKQSELIPQLVSLKKDGFAIKTKQGKTGILFHQRRRFDDGELLFLVNTSIDGNSEGSIVSPGKSIQQWDPTNGIIKPYPFNILPQKVTAEFNLPPCGSLLLFISHKQGKNTYIPPENIQVIKPASGLKIRRTELNVLTLDYVDITAAGKSLKNSYFYPANQFAFRQNGMGGDPWDSAVQFRDEIINKKFPPESGFTAAYHFNIKDKVPAPLYAVVERPDLYHITCNGKEVQAKEGDWWLDKSFGKIDISSAAQAGENTLVLKAKPMTIYHELESVYLLGDFALQAVDKGFVIAQPKALELGPWNKQGMPFYAAGVSYTQNFTINNPQDQYLVRLPNWYGSVAQVVVNRKLAGFIAWRPWQCDVSKYIKPGQNTVEVVVIGTLRNTLGPHHNGNTLGAAWPGMFRKGPNPGPPPGTQYSTVGYGLFSKFKLCSN